MLITFSIDKTARTLTICSLLSFSISRVYNLGQRQMSGAMQTPPPQSSAHLAWSHFAPLHPSSHEPHLPSTSLHALSQWPHGSVHWNLIQYFLSTTIYSHLRQRNQTKLKFPIGYRYSLNWRVHRQTVNITASQFSFLIWLRSYTPQGHKHRFCILAILSVKRRYKASMSMNCKVLLI